MKKGLFLSRNHGRISETVDLEGLARQFADVAVVRVYDDFLARSEQLDILERVNQHKLDAIVFAGQSAASFGTEGHALLEALRNLGVNQNKITVANIDEHVAMVHTGACATRKAGLLIAAALTKVEYCHAIDTLPISPQRSVLIIGTTKGAVVAAQALLARHYKVHIVERGAAFRSDQTKSEKFQNILSKVKSHPGVDIIFDGDLAGLSGWCGDYSVELTKASGPASITVGGILLCVGDDIGWIADLRPKLRLDTDERGLLAGALNDGFSGKTKDPGVWFIPHKEADPPAVEAADARAAVHGLTALLDQAEIDHPVLVSEVDETLCGGCGTCVKTCAFSASGIDAQRKISLIDAKRCVGCGNCVTSCPTGARDLIACPTRYVFKAIDILSQGALDNDEPLVLAFLCKNSGYPAADAAGETAGLPTGNYSANVMPFCIECAGNIDTMYILHAFQRGFDGVALAVCKDGHCHNMVGNMDMERRLGLLRAVLRSRHIDGNRMRIIHTAAREGKRLNESLKDFSEELKAINRH